MVTETMRTQVLELYTAYFNRAADRAGVDYWLNEMDANGWDVLTVASSFTDSPEYTNLYGSKSNAQIVESVYQNVLGRSGDDAGVAYWLGELDGGTIAVQNFITAVVNAATEEVNGAPKWPQDKAMVDNKSAVSQYCYDLNINDTDISLASVTSDSSSVEIVKSGIVQSLGTIEFTFADAGSTIYGTTSNGTIALSLANNTASWQYSVDGGKTWANGSDTSFTLSEGNYRVQDILVKQLNTTGTETISMINPDISTLVQLEAIDGAANYSATNLQIAALANGEFAVAFEGWDSGNPYPDMSIFVQKFNSDGTAAGSMVRLEAEGNLSGKDYVPQISAVGINGDYVVAFNGVAVDGGYSIYIQKFNADGTPFGSVIELEPNYYAHNPKITSLGADGEFVVVFTYESTKGIYIQKFGQSGAPLSSAVEITGWNIYGSSPEVTAVGTDGEFVVAFVGNENYNDSIYVQKFNADGTTVGNDMVKLEAIGITGRSDVAPQITSIGTDGEFVVTFSGQDSNNNAFTSVFVQKFNADGTITGNDMVKLEAIDVTDGSDTTPQITSVGTEGEFVVAFSGRDNDTVYSETSVFVQKFNPDGTITGNDMVKLEPIGVTSGSDLNPQITSVGTDGAFVVTFSGNDSQYSSYSKSVFVQKFNADGTITGNDMVKLEGAYSNYQVVSIGTDGEFVVAFDNFVQKFNADGTIAVNSIETIKVDKTAPEITIGFEMAPNSKSPIFKGTTEIGATITIDVAGATYITTAADGTWSLDTTTAEETYGTLNLDYNGTNLVSATATDIAGNSSSQNYNYATQSEVSYFTGYELKAPVGFYGYDEYYGNEITAIGTSGEFIVTFAEMQSSILFPDCDISDIDYDSLVFVQKFNELAEPIGPIIQLDKADNTASQQYPKITEIGTNGEFIVTYTGLDIHEDGCSYDSSVFVQKFSAAGIPVGPLIHLDAGRNETSPQVTEIGTDGEFVVTFSSYGLVYVQKFNADGTVIPDSMVTMRVLSDDYANAVTPHDTVQIGTEGEFVVTYGGEDNIYVQKFDSDGVASGSLVQLEGVTLDDYTIPKITALGADGEFAVAYKTYGGVKVSKFNTDGTVHTEFSDSISSGYGYDPQIEALGTNGEFAVVYSGYDFEENFIHIQKFYPDGTKNGSVIEIISPDNSFDYTNWQITSLGTDGAFAVTFMKIHHSGEGDSSIYVQKFNPNATEAGSLIELKGPNNTDSNYEYPQIAAVGSDEEFVITFSGIDTQGDYSIFIQKFDTNGIPVENSIDLNTVELVGVTTDDTVLF